MVMYWRRMNAIAPSKIMPATSCMAGVPLSRRSTSLANHKAKRIAITAAGSTSPCNMSDVISILLVPPMRPVRRVAAVLGTALRVGRLSGCRSHVRPARMGSW